MGKLLFIDSDDIQTLSEALKVALERRGVRFNSNGSGEFDYPTSDDEIDDIDPYIGVMPKMPNRHKESITRGGDDNWLFQESGGVRYNSGSCGGGCGYTPSYGGCGGRVGHVTLMGSCGNSHC